MIVHPTVLAYDIDARPTAAPHRFAGRQPLLAAWLARLPRPLGGQKQLPAAPRFAA